MRKEGLRYCFTLTLTLMLSFGLAGTIVSGNTPRNAAPENADGNNARAVELQRERLNLARTNGVATNPVIFGQITDANNVGVANVAVTLSGVRSQVISTDANGYYLFEDPLSGFNYSVIPNSPYYVFTPLRADIANLPPNGQTQNFTIQPGSVPTNGPVIDDDFNSSTLNLNKWNVGLLTQTAGFTPEPIGGRQCAKRLCIQPPSGSGNAYGGYVGINNQDRPVDKPQ